MSNSFVKIPFRREIITLQMDQLYLTLLITFVSERTDKIFPDTTMVVIVDSLSKKTYKEKEGYTVTMYNLDGVHPLWKNNVQMAP